MKGPEDTGGSFGQHYFRYFLQECSVSRMADVICFGVSMWDAPPGR